ncbi:MAG TPA: AmmeMemoRadiSam system radical SAM enzyme [Candidatus Eisenbergiella intestinigallinarum]|uniref:AmmeMemoRadiSam system radical SAM enzyme n=1 Tax=Candidatus Eisenbergiella intestinigallinarum TaxID=2838549 RepID=A0A9D2TRK0_9FIRM|nr:AmmeMemoRadiSam system radical SAM enzyme [Candidatus Eisenbergiella intestinigallinarum]
MKKEKSLQKREAVCPVCPHHCLLAAGQTGRCRARKNREGKIVSINYGKLTSLMLDPIEKKPLRRFFPGSRILSVGSFGCNLACPFCQNYEISMADSGQAHWQEVTPEALAGLAQEYQSYGNIGVAFTYNEPLVGYEFVRDTARLVRERGMKNVLVTNGCAEPLVLEELLPYVDAMNIDLKGFTGEWYEKLGGDLETVKRFIARAAQDCHVELTTLIVPGENDSEEEMDREARWIASLDWEIPLHVTRFFPQYRMADKVPTPVERVYRLRNTAAQWLRYVYVGNC